MLTTSLHKKGGQSLSTHIVLALSKMILFFFSSTPFWCGTYDVVSSRHTPCSSQKEEKLIEKKLTTSITSKCFDHDVSFKLCTSFKNFEFFKTFNFIVHEIGP
jgi:hypothetical protein